VAVAAAVALDRLLPSTSAPVGVANGLGVFLAGEAKAPVCARGQAPCTKSFYETDLEQAVEAVADVRDNMQSAIDRSLKDRPYTTLVLTGGFGFLLGALWAR
jgi:hypothetical protein